MHTKYKSNAIYNNLICVLMHSIILSFGLQLGVGVPLNRGSKRIGSFSLVIAFHLRRSTECNIAHTL